MTYFGLVALKRYFKEQLQDKAWEDKEDSLDNVWDYYLTELIHQVKKKHGEQDKTEQKEESKKKDLFTLSAENSNPAIKDLVSKLNELLDKNDKDEKKQELIELPYSLYFSADEFLKWLILVKNVDHQMKMLLTLMGLLLMRITMTCRCQRMIR